MNNKVDNSKWAVVEKERIYEAFTTYDNSASYLPNTKISINMELYNPKAKPADFLKEDSNGVFYGFIARVTSMDGMCHMTFNVVTTKSDQYFELEFYDIVSIGYGSPKFQKIYEDLSPYIKLKLQYLPTTVEKFVEILITWFEDLESLLRKYRYARKKAIEKDQEELKELEAAE